VFRIKVPTRLRAVQLKIDSTDAVGTTAAFSRSIWLK
jgi:hypothetical protein